MSINERTMELDLNLIVFDDELKVRVETDPDTIRDYYDAMETEEDVKKFPPPTVYFDGHRYWLADGHHRYWAAKRRGYAKITVRVINGSHDEAILAAVKLNLNHGLRFNEGDWERIVTLITNKEQWSDWSNRKLAEELGCSHWTVMRYRPESDSESDSGGRRLPPEKRRGKDGKLYPVKAKKKAEQATATEPAQAEPIVTESKQEITEAPTPEVVEAALPELETVEESPSVDQHLIDLNVKQTQIEATISLLETQLFEWLEIVQADEGKDFKQDIGQRIRALGDDFMTDVIS